MLKHTMLRAFLAQSTLLTTTFLATLGSPKVGHAQDVTPGDTVELDEVVLTSVRKIEEDVQRTPFGISIFDAETSQRNDIRDAQSAGGQTPGFNFVDTGIRASSIPNIRGVGSFLQLSSDDTSVPVFVDGIPVPLRAQDTEFFDFERVEILRGPQNTVLGGNAQAGAINVTTASPSDIPSLEIAAGGGNFQSARVELKASGPLSDKVGARLSAQFRSREGDIPDISQDDDVRDQQVANVNGKLVWQPTDSTDVTLGVRFSSIDEQPTVGAFQENPDFPELAQESETNFDIETIGVGVTIAQDFEHFTFTSVTGYLGYESNFFNDTTDGLAFSAFTGLPPAFFDDPTSDFSAVEDDGLQISQEFRLSGELNNGTKWVTGINYLFFDLDVVTTPNLPTPVAIIDGVFDSNFQTQSIAGFGEVTVPLNDRLSVISGVRYTFENKTFDTVFTDVAGFGTLPTASDSGGVNFNLVTGRFAVTYDFLPRLTGFASFSRGAKSGGFELIDTDVAFGADNGEFDSAFTFAYEAGFRGSVFDDRLSFSLSGFFNDTSDELVQVFDIIAFESDTENVDTETFGVEVEAVVQPVDGLDLSAGFAFLQTEITSSGDPTIAVGNEVPNTPNFSLNLAGEYNRPVKIFDMPGDIYGRVEYRFVGAREIDPQNNLELDSYQTVALRAGWKNERISADLFVTNLFDATFSETGLFLAALPSGETISLAVPGQPRRYGGSLRIRF